MHEVVRIPLDSLRVDGGTQVRTRIDADAVAHYARELDDLPPVLVVFDGAAYWLADGFHRVAAARSEQRADIEAQVRAGTQRDAVLLACGANSEHGVRRTNADKRAAVNVLLTDATWCTWSDRAIAEACGVSHVLVGQLRSAHAGGEGWKNYHPPPDDGQLDDSAGPMPAWDEPMSTPVTTAALDLLAELQAAAAILGAELVDPADPARPFGHAVDRLEAESVEVCVLLPVLTTAPWFADAWDWPLCFIGAPVAGRASVVAYVGRKLEAFERAFATRGHIVAPTPFGGATLKREHKGICAECGKPCSSGRWCPSCKQRLRADRVWIRDAVAIAQRDIAAGKTPSPARIATRVHHPWRDVVAALIREGVGSKAMHAEWQKHAHLARKGGD